MNNKTVKEIPPAVWEFMFCAVFSWKIEDVRSLPERDFRTLAPMVLNKFALDCYKGQS
jgi:hypothetical protein